MKVDKRIILWNMIDAKIRLGLARAGMKSISPDYQEINQYLDEVSELLSAR